MDYTIAVYKAKRNGFELMLSYNDKYMYITIYTQITPKQGLSTSCTLIYHVKKSQYIYMKH